jgi:hypothetical protein
MPIMPSEVLDFDADRTIRYGEFNSPHYGSFVQL